MSKKFLGRVVAGAALGSASLLVCAPGMALADDSHKVDEGKVFTKPHVAKPGHEVTFIEVCTTPQDHAWVWSKVTGKVKLKPKEYDKKDYKDEENSKYEKGYKDHEDYMGSGGSYEPPSMSDEEKQDEPKKDDAKKDDFKKDDLKKDDLKKDDLKKDDLKKDDLKKDDFKKDDLKKDDFKKDALKKDDLKTDDLKKDDFKKDDFKKDWESKKDDTKDEHSKKDESKKDDPKVEHSKKDWGDKKDDPKVEHGKKDDPKKDSYKKDSYDTKFVYWKSVEIPQDAKPGHYELKGSCGEGELVILPTGSVDGGDGGAGGRTDIGLATGGASMLGAAALGGLVLMRRRRINETLA
jgi:hypothetical protein